MKAELEDVGHTEEQRKAEAERRRAMKKAQDETGRRLATQRWGFPRGHTPKHILAFTPAFMYARNAHALPCARLHKHTPTYAFVHMRIYTLTHPSATQKHAPTHLYTSKHATFADTSQKVNRTKLTKYCRNA